MKRISKKIISLLALAVPTVAFAVPATQKPVKFRQPDGTIVTLLLNGDEHSHYTTDRSGYPVEIASNGFYCYIGNDGQLTDIKLTAKGREDATVSSRGLTEKNAADVVKTYLERRLQDNASTPLSAKLYTQPNKSAAIGKRKVPVLLVEFPDASFTLGTKARFNDMMNKEGYDYDGATGSCLDYFKDNSSGLFSPEFEVYGPVKLDHERSYYGQNDANGNEMYLGNMIKEACQKLDSEIDFSQYDYDNDGYLDYVYVYYAGMGEHDTAIKSLVWPQSWFMSNTYAGTFQCDGVTVEKFATSNELQSNGSFVGIGVFVHEFSHVLGLPDLYATTYNTQAFTPGDWSVLGHGPYNNEGRTPPNYSAYERSELGWLELTELSNPADITLSPVSNNAGYRISTESPDEYFVFENRQQEGWDAYIPGHGMLVWHIDYDETRWKNNLVNTDHRHQYVDIEEADAILDESTRSSDAFPGTRHVTSFTDDTTPAMLSWAGIRQNKPITNITETAEGNITFKVMGGYRNVYAPTDLKTDAVTPTAFTLSWTPCTDCDYQLLSVYTKDVDGNKTFVDGYKNMRLNSTDATTPVQLLQPSTCYYAVITSATEYEQKESDELCITTLSPTFDMLTAQTLEPTQVDNNSFVANWLPLEGADSYELTVKKRTVDTTPRSESCDFTGKQLPEGWNGELSSYFSASGYYGESAPAASMAASGQFVESCRYGTVSSLSVWMRTMSYSSLCSLKVLALINDSWTEIDDIPMPQSSDGAMTKSWHLSDATLPAGVKAVRLELTTTGDKTGRLIIDDVKIGYTLPDVDDTFADYSHKNVGATTSQRLELLESGKLYLYTVRGVSNGVKSLESAEQLVQLGTTAINDIPNDEGVCVKGNTIIINDSHKKKIRLYGYDGAEVNTAFKKLSATTSAITLRSGIYIICIDNKSFKVKI